VSDATDNTTDDTADSAAGSMMVRRRIGLVAHDHKKNDLVDWAS
jgi:hypothetical protein